MEMQDELEQITAALAVGQDGGGEEVGQVGGGGRGCGEGAEGAGGVGGGEAEEEAEVDKSKELVELEELVREQRDSRRAFNERLASGVHAKRALQKSHVILKRDL